MKSHRFKIYRIYIYKIVYNDWSIFVFLLVFNFLFPEINKLVKNALLFA